MLSDAFSEGDWTAGSYAPANETTAVDAMAVEVDCYTRQPQQVEYRFAQVRGQLAVEVAQDMRSASPDVEVEFSLEADGRQISAKNVKFKDKAELTTDLAGVTVLRIGAKTAPNQAACKGTANALITSIVVEQ